MRDSLKKDNAKKKSKVRRMKTDYGPITNLTIKHPNGTINFGNLTFGEGSVNITRQEKDIAQC